jgi:hypothetical protein
MRLVLHRKVHSDVDAIMSITSASPAGSLLTISTLSYGASCWTRRSGPNRFPSASTTFAGSTSIVSLTIFCFALSATQCGFLSFDIIGGIPRWASVADEPVPNRPYFSRARANRDTSFVVTLSPLTLSSAADSPTLSPPCRLSPFPKKP